jgi:glucosamine--fructose-6-phosphate aminotransferase (isomerizing)
MCGIAGITRGGKDGGALRMTVDALKRLEYRGYDSFGVSVFCPAEAPGAAGTLVTKKSIGSVSERDAKGFFSEAPDGASAIAHTRWATHGGVTEANAHPHVSNDGAFSLVHNGVIENHRELRKKLEHSGVVFSSETDTEVIVHLIASLYAKTKDAREALRQAVRELQGEYAIVFVTTHEPGKLFAAKHKSPLAFARADGTTVVASDQRAIGPLSSDITFLEDGDVAVLTPEIAELFHIDANGALSRVERESVRVPWSGEDGGLFGYPHYMLKEIHEIPTASRTVFSIARETLDAPVADMQDKTLSITGAGSSFYVSQIGQYYFNDLAGVYARVHPSDEMLALAPFSARDHLIAVSQSGETFDTMEVMRAAKDRGAKVTAINNVLGSSSQRLADFPVFQGSGTEVCVLSTKSIVSQALILYRLAKLLGLARGVLSPDDEARLSADERRFLAALEPFFAESEEKIREIGSRNSVVENWFFIGRGIHYPVAMESALKFKEVSYRHAEGMPAGFFKHGTISLIDDRFYTMAFLPNDESDPEHFKLTLSNISEIHARGGRVIAVGHSPREAVGEVYDYIRLPSVNEHLDPLFELIAGELLAYYCAVALGRNIDKPRALAKAVTVR